MMGRQCGWCWIILGILILINQFWLNWDWWTFVGIIFILKGFSVMKCCGMDESSSAPSKRRKR